MTYASVDRTGLTDRLEFIGDRLRFEKSSLRCIIVGIEEIEETSEDSTEISRLREQKTAHAAG